MFFLGDNTAAVSGIGRIRRSRWAKPYQKGGTKTNLLNLKGRSGVYMIRYTGQNRPIYIGSSTGNLYKTILRHFQTWESADRYDRGTFDRRRAWVRVLLCPPAQARRLEMALILKHQPSGNPIKYQQLELSLKDRELIKQAESAPIDIDPFWTPQEGDIPF